MKNNRYLIVGCPRSGTTVIHLMLKGHPNVAALNDELLVSPLFTQGLSAFTHGNDSPEEKKRGLSVLFDALVSMSASDSTTTCGAKCTCLSPAQARVLVDALRQHLADLKVILVVRNDLVAQYGSHVSARQSNVWHSWNKGAAERKIRPLTINRWLFAKYAMDCLDMLDTLKGLCQTHEVIDCIYEDFLAAPQSVYERLIDFLGLPCVEVTWLRSEKVMPPPEKYIRNYAEMAHWLEQLRVQHARGGLPPMTRVWAERLTWLNQRLAHWTGLRIGNQIT